MSARAAACVSARASKTLSALLLLAALLGACSTGEPPPAERYATAERLARDAQLQPRLSGGPLPLSGYLRQRDPAQPITIYIEGDGQSWVSRYMPARDPTPSNPLALRLAILDPAANIGWLARPCMYAGRSVWDCGNDALWTSERFSEAAVTATMRGIDALALPGQKIHLVGFSGGGGMAALVAARRRDVLSLRTVAGNLDHVALNRHHKVAPMRESLNPVEFSARLSALPQRHFVGGKDDLVPRLLADSFLRRQSVPAGCQRLEILPGAEHNAGWAEAWPRLVSQPVC